MDKINKLLIIGKVILLLKDNIALMERSLTGISDAIKDAPGAMQSHSDTTRSQLAPINNANQRSLNEKKSELESFLRFINKDISKIKINKSQIGVIVLIKKEGGPIEYYFLLPAGSGIKLEHEGKKIICLTITSPLGQALLGKKKNEKFLLKIGATLCNTEILDLI